MSRWLPSWFSRSPNNNPNTKNNQNPHRRSNSPAYTSEFHYHHPNNISNQFDHNSFENNNNNYLSIEGLALKHSILRKINAKYSPDQLLSGELLNSENAPSGNVSSMHSRDIHDNRKRHLSKNPTLNRNLSSISLGKSNTIANVNSNANTNTKTEKEKEPITETSTISNNSQLNDISKASSISSNNTRDGHLIMLDPGGDVDMGHHKDKKRNINSKQSSSNIQSNQNIQGVKNQNQKSSPNSKNKRSEAENKENDLTIKSDIKYLVDTLRSIAEILIWGDQNDTQVFEYFLEQNIFAHFLNVLYLDLDKIYQIEISVQVLQTLNILFENLKLDTSYYFLLSKNHINEIISYDFRFEENEEMLAYYISFLKTLSLKLNENTVHFYFNEHANRYPLYLVDGGGIKQIQIYNKIYNLLGSHFTENNPNATP